MFKFLKTIGDTSKLAGALNKLHLELKTFAAQCDSGVLTKADKATILRRHAIFAKTEIMDRMKGSNIDMSTKQIMGNISTGMVTLYQGYSVTINPLLGLAEMHGCGEEIKNIVLA